MNAGGRASPKKVETDIITSGAHASLLERFRVGYENLGDGAIKLIINCLRHRLFLGANFAEIKRYLRPAERRDYLLIEQFLRENVRDVDRVDGGGGHSSLDREEGSVEFVFSACVRLFCSSSK